MRASKLWSRLHIVPSPFLASHTLWIKKMEICWRHQSSRSFQTWKLEIEKIHTLRNIAHHKQTSIHVLATNSLDIGKFAEAWSYTCIHYHLLPVTVVTEYPEQNLLPIEFFNSGKDLQVAIISCALSILIKDFFDKFMIESAITLALDFM